MFRVPSSTPPSTPDSRRPSRFAPSTTPAGPPPDHSVIPSSTPAGPPPAANSLFGNSRPNFQQPPSRFNFQTSTYGSSPPKSGLFVGTGLGSIRASTSGRPGSRRGRTSSSGFRVPSSPPRATQEEDDDEDAEGSEEDDEDEGMEEDGEGDDEEIDEESNEEEIVAAQRAPRVQNRLSQSVVSRTSATDSVSGPTVVRVGAKQSQYDLMSLAKGLSPSFDHANLHEPDEVILGTEQLMERLSDSYNNDAPDKRASVVGDIAHELLALWQASSREPARGGLSSSRPGAATALSNATRLTSLLLNIHHPNPKASAKALAASTLALTRRGIDTFTPIPKVLLDWLNTYRNLDSEIDVVLKETAGYSRHRFFWDTVRASASRGQFLKTMELLKGSNFEVAETAYDDTGSSGYTGAQLDYARRAALHAFNILDECPAVRSDDWDVKGHDWSIFRRRVREALSELEDLAEGDSKNRHSVSQPLQASHFGISQSQAMFQLSTRSRKAECKVPWSVYQNLSRLYQLLLGNEEEILAISADWVDATLGLTIWWDGDEEEGVPQGSLAASRRSIARSQRIRTVDVIPVKAYTQRLAAAFAAALGGEDEFTINTTDRVEVGLACIIDDNVEGALQILRGSSLVVAAAVAEVATAAGWFTRADGILNQFDRSDLMVLSFTEQQRSGVSQDDLLSAYSKLLTTRHRLTSQDGTTTREGWELAIKVLGRMEETDLANERIEGILNQLDLQSGDRVDKIIQLCHNLGLSKQALGIALKYADHLRANTQNYGDTLLYYARAHAGTKIQEVLRVLVAHCLVKSLAYPPPAELDDSLNSLITSPKQTLTKLSSLDSEAAQLLSNGLSGYATIRKFYDLRDEEVLLKTEKPAHRPMARKRAAANALTVIISSAASSIQGGLYDPEVETVVQVDVLLPLLGEALVFVNQPKRTLTLRHLYSLLAAIEDLSTAPSMIQAQCEEVLNATLGSSDSSLGKSTSNITTTSSQYSLIGSMDLSSIQGLSTESSAVLVKGGSTLDDAKRGWDWRKGFPRGAKGDDVIRVLRLGIAREIGRAFAEGEVTPA
ncbi:hypothetical protein K458DRAFT_379093 [Lentithecium fluviatile CBS 122367]|uniref:Nuclear pore complex protein Nup85 n=1 Tax=Lentithecium fluviatile CBS 122367 TaxID=1168545 RepID=A0A6G1IG90_9PLEO|nr:hypothetical protein K458DRAFT_379093 [Lentithecium fluviatile CBS 122367]